MSAGERGAGTIVLTGRDLTVEQVAAVARADAVADARRAGAREAGARGSGGAGSGGGGSGGGVSVDLSADAIERMRASRAVIDELVAGGDVVYGVTTGFGDLATHRIDPAEVDRLQVNLLVSHAVGVGRPLDREIVRAMLLLRANTLALGFSGCRVEVVERLLDLLAAGIHPIVPEQGSVGASGDLAPLAHLALPLIGRGEVERGGRRMPALEALREVGIEPLRLAAKEGLALLNGTQMMTAIGALLVDDAERLLATASTVAAMSVEALLGTDVAFAAAYQEARPHPGQMAVAGELRHLLRDSALIQSHHGTPHKVQDPYSIRCVPQVHGAARDALGYVRSVVEIEINAATDNPLVFPDGEAADPSALATGRGQVVSGGNFHGEPVAMALDLAKIALAEVASISERRTALLVDGKMSGLPPFLAEEAGLNSGFMLLQYTAASLVSENKVLAHPASVDSIPTSANQEDHVSMGATAARHAREILRNAQQVLALELLCAAQGLDFRLAGGGPRPGAGVAEAHRLVRGRIAHLDSDRDLGPDIAAAVELVQGGELAALAAAAGSAPAGSAPSRS